MSAFNGDEVVNHFNLSPAKSTDHAAMKYMYRTMKDEIPARSAEARQEITQLTIEKIEFRYDLYKRFVEDFFFGDPYDKDALALAVICDEYVNHINEPYQDEVHDQDGAEEGTDIPHKNDGFDDELVLRACTIWEEATVYESGAVGDNQDELSPESLFLAHIHVFENLREHEERAHEYEEHEIREILKKDIPAARSFAKQGTEIGNHLLKFLAHMEQELSVHIAPKEPPLLLPPPRPRPALYLVPKPETP